MKVIKTDNYAEMSKYTATYIINRLKVNKSLVLGLATGGTPLGTYQYLIEDHKSNNTSYSQVKTINLDEYIGLGKENKNSYHYFMNQYLFKDIDILEGNTFIPNGLANNLQEECERYENLINKMEGIDLQILGIGLNGHIGFNEPGTPFSSRTHVVDLTPSTREANTRFFPSKESVPKKAITMGIKTIMESKEILLLASGSKKAEALYKLLTGRPDEQYPASELLNHPKVTIIADQDALSLYLSRREKLSLNLNIN